MIERCFVNLKITQELKIELDLDLDKVVRLNHVAISQTISSLIQFETWELFFNVKLLKIQYLNVGSVKRLPSSFCINAADEAKRQEIQTNDSLQGAGEMRL